jgi:Predicted hydrolases or acyltransferases (alpha/beta hydrolase superfamily)
MDASRQKLKQKWYRKNLIQNIKKMVHRWRKIKNIFIFAKMQIKQPPKKPLNNALLSNEKIGEGLKNLNKILNETLIIWGDKDTSYNFEQIDTLKKNIPNSKLVIINGCSHNAHLEKPEKFNEIIENFLLN